MPGRSGRPARSRVPSFVIFMTRVRSARATDTSTAVGSACFCTLRIASTSTDCTSGSRCGGTCAASPETSRRPRRACSRSSRRSSSTSRASVGGERRPSGRWTAPRRSCSAPWSSILQRSRVSASSSPSPDNASEIPNSRCTTRSWISRARSIRASSSRARMACRVALRAVAASAAVLPRLQSRWRSESVSGPAFGRRSPITTPIQRTPATIGVTIRVRPSTSAP